MAGSTQLVCACWGCALARISRDRFQPIRLQSRRDILVRILVSIFYFTRTTKPSCSMSKFCFCVFHLIIVQLPTCLVFFLPVMNIWAANDYIEQHVPCNTQAGHGLRVSSPAIYDALKAQICRCQRRERLSRCSLMYRSASGERCVVGSLNKSTVAA